eukprot:17180-Heterococcus_DN1.PRE.2
MASVHVHLIERNTQSRRRDSQYKSCMKLLLTAVNLCSAIGLAVSFRSASGTTQQPTALCKRNSQHNANRHEALRHVTSKNVQAAVFDVQTLATDAPES